MRKPWADCQSSCVWCCTSLTQAPPRAPLHWGTCLWLYLNGLWYVHLVNFNLRKATSGHILVLLLIAIKQVSGIDANTDGPLWQKNKPSASGLGFVGRKTILHTPEAMGFTGHARLHWPTEHECHSSHQAAAEHQSLLESENQVWSGRVTYRGQMVGSEMKLPGSWLAIAYLWF